MAKDDQKKPKPPLRFPEFRDAPGWDDKVLGEICEINPPSKGLPASFIYIDLGSVEDGVLNTRRRISQSDAPSRAQRLLEQGDIVFQIVRPYQRNNLFAQFADGDTYVASTGYAQLRAHGDSSFLYHALHTTPFVGRVIGKCTGSSYPAINSSDLANIALSVPSSPVEQRKIAECLSSLDELIVAQKRKVAELATYKRGVIQQLFPQEDETLPRFRIPDFAQTPWTRRSIGDLLKESIRPIEMKDSESYSLVTVKRRYGGVVPRGVFRGESIKVKTQFLVRANDFLISKRQIVHNACGLVPSSLDGSIVSNEYSVLTPRTGCNIAFFNYFVQQPCVSKSFLDSSVGIVIEKMLFKLDRWLNCEFLFPTVEEQRRIADCILALDAQLAGESKKLSALKAHKQGLMQQIFPAGDE